MPHHYNSEWKLSITVCSNLEWWIPNFWRPDFCMGANNFCPCSSKTQLFPSGIGLFLCLWKHWWVFREVIDTNCSIRALRKSMSSCDLYGKVNSSVKSKHSVINPLSSE